MSYLCRGVLRAMHCMVIPGFLTGQVGGNAFAVIFAVGHCNSVAEICLNN